MAHHATVVAAPRDLGSGNAPVVLQRDDEDFVEAVMEALRTQAGRQGLASNIAATRTGDQILKLFQPIQRQFHLALVEAWCDTPGRPRIDPARVDTAGMVLRRIRTDIQGRTYFEGWMRAAGQLRGWVAVDHIGDDRADPQPAARLAHRATGDATIDRLLARLVADTDAALLNEHVIPMFATPPDVCRDAGRTVYYGVIPTSSSELASAPPDLPALFDGFGPASQAFAAHLMPPLLGEAYAFPHPGEFFDSNWFEAIEQPGDGPPQGIVANVMTTMDGSLFSAIATERAAFAAVDATTALHKFILLLRQVATEFDAFGTSAQSQTLFALLETITLTYTLQPLELVHRTVTAGTFLKVAAQVLLERDPAIGAVEMPERWPALGDTARQQLAAALSQAMQARFAAVKGRSGRFDEPDARYCLRAFVRVKADSGCPVKTIWSDYSEAFVIAPWYEGAGTPAQIMMPDLTDRELLKSLKPNVSFVLPPSLQCMLGGSPKDMMEGKFSQSCKKDNSGVTLGWICSFSIPIITLCAFIVLNIFLSLFDLFFRWMLFIKICIPFPKAGKK